MLWSSAGYPTRESRNEGFDVAQPAGDSRNCLRSGCGAGGYRPRHEPGPDTSPWRCARLSRDDRDLGHCVRAADRLTQHAASLTRPWPARRTCRLDHPHTLVERKARKPGPRDGPPQRHVLLAQRGRAMVWCRPPGRLDLRARFAAPQVRVAGSRGGGVSSPSKPQRRCSFGQCGRTRFGCSRPGKAAQVAVW